MQCKTCDYSLKPDFRYCPNCGAKVIRKRLTLKNIGQDISFQVFNLDNTLLRTIHHLFSKPQEVIESFIGGTRKRYMNPVSFFAIAITLSGVLFFVLRNVYHINLTDSSVGETATADMNFIFDYQGLLSYLTMPLYALMTWVLFLDKKKLNYTEHLVANAYITGQYSFAQFAVALPIFGLFEIKYDVFNLCFLAIIVGYQFYVLGRIHKTSLPNTILRALGYIFLFALTTLGVGVLFFLISLMTGIVSLEDFKS